MIGTRQALPDRVRGRVVTLVENGVDLSLWQQNDSRSARLSAAAPDRDIRFAFTGRLMEIKGVDFLLRAFAEVVKQVPGATLDILGDGEMRKPWEALAASLGLLGERVKFHGWVAQNQVPELLGKADALLLPSLHECGGTVVLEAMAMGLPVIATDWGGPADYIDPSCGILVPPQSPQQFEKDLAAAMIKLAENPELRRQMGRAGRRKIEEEFDWERKTDRILEIYREAIAAGGLQQPKCLLGVAPARACRRQALTPMEDLLRRPSRSTAFSTRCGCNCLMLRHAWYLLAIALRICFAVGHHFSRRPLYDGSLKFHDSPYPAR